MTVRKFIILRGPTGAGKSTLAERFCRARAGGATVEIFSADAYHVAPDGTYRFNIAQANAAHGACFRRAMDFARQEHPVDAYALIDNTNTRAWEAAPYVLLATACGWAHVVYQFTADLPGAWRRNTHRVPARTAVRQWQAVLLEELPAHWNVVYDFEVSLDNLLQ